MGSTLTSTMDIQLGESCQINIGRTHTKCCPHLAMQRYLGQVTRSARKPLFLFESGTALTARALRLAEEWDLLGFHSRHSTNSGSICDRPVYEPPAGDYPGVHISSVLPTPYEWSQESSEQQPNVQVPCPRGRTFHASSPPQAKTSTDYKRDARADAFTT